MRVNSDPVYTVEETPTQLQSTCNKQEGEPVLPTHLHFNLLYLLPWVSLSLNCNTHIRVMDQRPYMYT